MKITDEERANILFELGVIVGTLQMCENQAVGLAIDSADLIKDMICNAKGEK